MLNMTNGLKRALLIGAMALGGAVGNANAVLISATNGTLSASANFSINGSGQLVVVLTNTGVNDVLAPGNVLTAMFFDLNGVGTLTPLSAALSGGSVAFYASLPAGGVGAGWQYEDGRSGLPNGQTEGISASGFGVFGPNGNFGSPAVTLNGIDFGLLSAGDNTGTGNGGITSGGPLIKDQITFTLSGLPVGFTDADLTNDLTNVAFQYGTALGQPTTEPCIGSCGPATTPEPSMPLLLGAGLLAWGVTRRYVAGRA
jgi:hypothetical protein